MYIIWIKSPALAFSKEYAELVLELKSFPKKSALSLSEGSPLRGPGKLLAACEKKSEKSEKWKVKSVTFPRPILLALWWLHCQLKIFPELAQVSCSQAKTL